MAPTTACRPGEALSGRPRVACARPAQRRLARLQHVRARRRPRTSSAVRRRPTLCSCTSRPARRATPNGAARFRVRHRASRHGEALAQRESRGAASSPSPTPGWGKAVWGKYYGQWLMEACVFTYDFDRFHPSEILSLIGEAPHHHAVLPAHDVPHDDDRERRRLRSELLRARHGRRGA